MLLENVRTKGLGGARQNVTIINNARMRNFSYDGEEQIIGKTYDKINLTWIVSNHEETRYLRVEIHTAQKWQYEVNEIYLKDIPESLYARHAEECRQGKLKVGTIINERIFGNGLIRETQTLTDGWRIYYLKDHWSKNAIEDLPETEDEWIHLANKQ